MEAVLEIDDMIKKYSKFAKDSLISDFVEELIEIKKGLRSRRG